MLNTMRIVGTLDNSVSQRFLLSPTDGKLNSYTLKILPVNEWAQETQGIKNLGKIIDVMNETCWDHNIVEAKAIARKLSKCAIKHNSNKWRYLKFILFPLIAKIWGCTLFTRYNETIEIKTKTRKNQAALGKVSPINNRYEDAILKKDDKRPLDYEANCEALYALLPPLTRELTPIQIMQTSRICTLSGEQVNYKEVNKDWVSTFAGFSFAVCLKMPRECPYTFSQLDVSPFIHQKCLILENCKGELPRGLEKLKLEELHLKNAELETLQENIGQIPLKVLQLEGCKMNRIPEVVFKIPTLENLYIDNLKPNQASNSSRLILDEESCNRLKALPNLKTLRIVNSGWEDEDLNELTQKLSPIEIVLHYTPFQIMLKEKEKEEMSQAEVKNFAVEQILK